MSQRVALETPREIDRPRLRLGWWISERPAIWIMPLAVVLFVSYLYPAVEVVRFSFTDATLLNPDYSYTLQSFGAVFDNPDFPGIVWTTFVFVVASVILQLTLGLLIALLLHRGVRRRLWGVAFLRIAILASWIVPGVAAGIVWQFIFNEASYGFLNGVLRAVGLRGMPWLSDPALAIWSAVLANVWRGTAFSMILLYAGLLVIPRTLYEAAEVDGASAPQQFRYITLPQLRPILLTNLILISIFTLNTFDLILPLTGGGPGRSTEVLALYAYNTVFRNFDLSNGSVLGVVLLVISVTFTLFYVRLMPKESEA
jgi:multiple sugar transport system permease protein